MIIPHFLLGRAPWKGVLVKTLDKVLWGREVNSFDSHLLCLLGVASLSSWCANRQLSGRATVPNTDILLLQSCLLSEGIDHSAPQEDFGRGRVGRQALAIFYVEALDCNFVHGQLLCACYFLSGSSLRVSHCPSRHTRR